MLVRAMVDRYLYAFSLSLPFLCSSDPNACLDWKIGVLIHADHP